MSTFTPFVPKDGVAQWEKVYELLAPLNFGDTLSYEQVLAQSGIDLTVNRGPMFRATREFEMKHLKTVECVRGFGYRVVQPNEHVRLARKYHRRGRRQVESAGRKLTYTDRSKLTTDEARRLDDLSITVNRHSDMLRRLDDRVIRVEKAIKDSRSEMAKLVDDRVEAAVAEKLARHGFGAAPEPTD